MKELSKEQIEKKVAVAFETYPAAGKIFATKDGNTFLDKNRAQLHAGKKGTVYPYDRPIPKESADSVEVDPAIPLSANEVIAAIKAVAALEHLKAFKGDERKSVKAAYEKRAKELEAAIQEVEVTQQMLDENQDLADQGVKVGDKIGIPQNDDK